MLVDCHIKYKVKDYPLKWVCLGQGGFSFIFCPGPYVVSYLLVLFQYIFSYPSLPLTMGIIMEVHDDNFGQPGWMDDNGYNQERLCILAITFSNKVSKYLNLTFACANLSLMNSASLGQTFLRISYDNECS